MRDHSRRRERADGRAVSHGHVPRRPGGPPAAHARPHRGEAAALEAWHRRAVYAVMATLAGSGILWLLYHQFLRIATPFGEGPHPLEVWWLRLHGLAAMLALIALGSLLATHVRRAWRQHRNRHSGAVLGIVLAVLIGTGYALYYFGSEETRPAISAVHWCLGLAVVAVLLTHIGHGRRARRHRAAR